MTKQLCESCCGIGCMTCAGEGFVKGTLLKDLAKPESVKAHRLDQHKYTMPKPQSFQEYLASAESEVHPKKFEISPYYQREYKVEIPKLEDLPSYFIVQRTGKEILRVDSNGDISGNVNEALEALANCVPDFRNVALKSALEILGKLNV